MEGSGSELEEVGVEEEAGVEEVLVAVVVAVTVCVTEVSSSTGALQAEIPHTETAARTNRDLRRFMCVRLSSSALSAFHCECRLLTRVSLTTALCRGSVNRKSRGNAESGRRKKGQKNALPPGLEPRMTVPKTVVLPITPWENARFDVHGSQYSSRVVHKKL